MADPVVQLVVALAAEAKPIASWFKLNRVHPERGFPVYRRQHIALVVAGPGKANAAAAAAYLYASCGYPENGIWINIGICGHADGGIGDIRLAHKISDLSSGRDWYPPLAFKAPCPSANLLTVDQPDLTYRRAELIDMEASGFYQTACRFTTGELIQTLKVVSDNKDRSADRIDAAQVYQLIGTALDTLDQLLVALGRLANELYEIEVPGEAVAPYLEHWRFTSTQGHQLRDLLVRWSTLDPSDTLWRREFSRVRNTKELIRLLAAHVDGLPIQL